MKYKVGDKVLIKSMPRTWSSAGGSYPFELSYPRKMVISRIRQCDGYVAITSEDGYGYSEESLAEVAELINKLTKNTIKNTMKKLNNLFKKLTDPSVQSLSEAGILNGDLELTEEGKKELMTILFLANKEELVKRAEEIIKEAKEDK